MTKASDNKFPKVFMEEVADDGSATTTPAADHRALFVGEDGNLHLKDSSATVTTIGGGGVIVQDEGTPLATTGTTLNFVGSGVAATGTGATKTITIGSGGGITQAYVGKNAVGASWEVGAATTPRMTCKKVTLANDALMTDIEIYMRMNADAAIGFVTVFLYDDNGSGTAPNSLLNVNTTADPRSMVLEDSGAGPRTARWFGGAIGRWCAAGDYWIGWGFDSVNLEIAYDTGGSDPRMGAATGGQIGDWGLWTPSDTTRDYSIRANTIR